MKIITDKKRLNAFIKDHTLSLIFDDRMIQQLQLHQFDPNERLIEEGSDVKYLYLVLEGEARVAPSSTEGKSGFLEYILPMDVIGDMEFFSHSPYFHSVVALTFCTYLAIPVKMIDAHFSHNISFYQFICENMASKMKRTSSRYSRSLLYPLKNRLANFLLEQKVRQHTNSITLQTEQIAQYFGVTSRHLRRVLSELEKEGIIKRVKDCITLIKPEVLEDLSSVMK